MPGFCGSKWSVLNTLLVTLVAIPAPAHAAGRGFIRGSVVNASGGVPLEKVSIRVEDTGSTAATDADGRFEIDGLDEGPHELYVSSVDFILIKRTVIVPATGGVDVTIAMTAGTGAYTETVTVTGQASDADSAAALATKRDVLGSTELQQLDGVIADDPMRAVQALPGVVAGDDYRSEFSVRGLGIDRMNFTFEGIASPFLLHTLERVVNAGSVAMVNGDVLASATLSSGTHAQRFGDRTGAELDFEMREGSRDRTNGDTSVSLTGASAVGEGPIGGARNGSWLVSVRTSYIGAFAKHFSPDPGLLFGFTDAQGKVVYDVTPRQQVQLAVTTGASHSDDPADADEYAVTHGTKDTTIGVATLRSLLSDRFTITQKVAASVSRFADTGPVITDHDRSHDLTYRADWSLALSPSTKIEGGAEVKDAWESENAGLSYIETPLSLDPGVSSSPQTDFYPTVAFDKSTVSAGAYVLARIRAGRGTIVPGVRVDRWALTKSTAASPWVQASWPLAHATELTGGAGISHQDPSFVQVYDGPDLRPERAYHADAGLDGTIGWAHWRADVYDREDRGFVRSDIGESKLMTVDVPAPSVPFAETRQVLFPAFVGAKNALNGYARGLDLVVEHRSQTGLSGWLSYSLGFSRYHDTTTGESFAGDEDQRHTVNLYGEYRVSDRTSVNARFRYGSNVPVTGYWREENGQYFLSDERNEVRVPAYSRLDVRVNRTFTWTRTRLTLYVEATNVLDRENVRSLGTVDFSGLPPYQAAPLFERLTPFIPALGARFEF
jgi:hypothetical protein